MVKHIVFWTLKAEAEGATRAENARRVKAALEALAGRIPGLVEIEVGIDFARSDASYDVALYSTFVDRAALDAYQAHPEHRTVADLIAKVREKRAVVDYEKP